MLCAALPMSSTETQRYKCEACGVSFNSQGELNNLNQQNHPGEATRQQ